MATASSNDVLRRYSMSVCSALSTAQCDSTYCEWLAIAAMTVLWASPLRWFLILVGVSLFFDRFYIEVASPVV